MTDAIRTAIDGASAYLSEHPNEARYTDSSATAIVDDRLHTTVTGPSGERLETDMPGAVGGRGVAPSPGWFLRAATAACVSSLAAMRAAQLRIAGFSISVEVDSVSDDRGILGVDPTTPAGPMSMRIAIRVSGPADQGVLDDVAHWAVEHCPVSDAVRRAVPVQVEVNVG